MKIITDDEMRAIMKAGEEPRCECGHGEMFHPRGGHCICRDCDCVRIRIVEVKKNK